MAGARPVLGQIYVAGEAKADVDGTCFNQSLQPRAGTLGRAIFGISTGVDEHEHLYLTTLPLIHLQPTH